ncbi:MAG: tetratricopeptide repeat protein [Gammaproteobacteria bacterium]|nr:tetratricopeptide repeat protein [Gammaproteobacteria bacterium]NNJ77619.1 tetratricopeptide repeat protein [Xanthomonadales bacterium]
MRTQRHERLISTPTAITLLFAAMLSACSSTGPAIDTPPDGPVVETVVPLALEPTDTDVMYRVFAGEYLGSERDLSAAVDEYLEAALLSQDPEIARRATRIAFAAEAWQQAVMAADRWAVLAPESVPAHESAANAMLRVGDFFGAEYALGRILEILEDSPDAWLLVSRILTLSGEPDQADATLLHLQGQRADADPADVYFARSKVAASARELEKAFEYARQAAELDPERVEFLAWAGRVALNLDLEETGIEYVRRAWELDSDNHDLALGFADLLARTGREGQARKVLEGMTQTPDVMLSRILFELSAQNRVAAEDLFGEFAGLAWDDSAEKSFYRAQAAEALGMVQQAIALYGSVTQGERLLAASLRRAELIALEGDMDSARAALARVREGGDAEAVEAAWLTEARILRAAGGREASFDVLTRALDGNPDSVDLLYTRSLLAAELRRVDAAERDLRALLAIEPENAAALNALGYTLADQTERYDEAEEYIRQAYILMPNEASVIDSMGWVAYRQGRLDEAEGFLSRAWTLDRNAEIAAHLGEVLWMKGEREKALEVLREGLDVDENNPVLRETLDRLGATP